MNFYQISVIIIWLICCIYLSEQAQQRKSLNINRVQGNNLNKSLQTSQIYYDVDRLLLWLQSSYTNIDLQNVLQINNRYCNRQSSDRGIIRRHPHLMARNLEGFITLDVFNGREPTGARALFRYDGDANLDFYGIGNRNLIILVIVYRVSMLTL